MSFTIVKHKISRRNNKTAKLEVKDINLPSEEVLQKDYSHLSLELIARKYNLTNTEPILTLLKKFNINKRNRSESRKLALETKRSISWNKGLSKEHHKVAKMIQHLNEKHMEKIDEARAKQSQTRKKLMREGRLIVWNKGKKLSPEHIEKMRDAKKKISDTPEFRAKMREIGMKAKPKYVNTKPEKLMRELLLKAGLTEGLKEQFPLIIDNFGTKPDFAYPQYKIAIYCDGEYWHGGIHHKGKSLENLKDGPQKESIKRIMKKDTKQHFVLWANGWVPLRFWQHDIEENPNRVIEQIKKNMFDENFINKREEKRKESLEYFKEQSQLIN